MSPDPDPLDPDALDPDTRDWALARAGARQLLGSHLVQRLWSGYGHVLRLELDGGRSVVLKTVDPRSRATHPRGWDGDRGDRRKRRSYEVEAAWYLTRAPGHDPACRIPRPIAIRVEGERTDLLIEDLGAAYPRRPTRLDERTVEPCLRWLAAFHAAHLHDAGDRLWGQGCYWHLHTRPDELRTMPDGELKRAATALDEALRGARHTTLVHGDAKLANFLFTSDGAHVAAVDFQYVGVGVGTRDLAYLLGSCLCEDTLALHHDRLLDRYDRLLIAELARRRPSIDGVAVAAEWRALHAVAWADFQRFLYGWSPGHAKLTGHAQRLTDQALRELKRA